MQSLQSTKTPFFPELDRIGWKAIPHEDDDYNPQYEWYRIERKFPRLDEDDDISSLFPERPNGIPLLFDSFINGDSTHSIYYLFECGKGIIEIVFDPYVEFDYAIEVLNPNDYESYYRDGFSYPSWGKMSEKEAEYNALVSTIGWTIYYPNLNDFLEDDPYLSVEHFCCSLDKLKVYGSSKYIPYYVINEYKISLDEWQHIEEPTEPNLWLELTFLFNTYKLYYCEKKNNKVECKVACNGELRATWKWEKGKHGLAKKFFEYVGFSTQRGSSTLWNRLHNLQRLNKSLFNDTISKISESDDLIDKAIVSISKYGKILNEIKSQFKVSDFFIQKYLEARIKQWNQSTGFLPVIKEMSYLDMLKSASATISYTYQPKSKAQWRWFATFLGYNINSNYDMDKYFLDVLAYFCYYVD